jgi:hypothetical protein
VERLGGRNGKVLISGGLMDAESKWKMADGSQFAWDGVLGYSLVSIVYISVYVENFPILTTVE